MLFNQLSEEKRREVEARRTEAVRATMTEITVGAESIQMARHADKMAHTARRLGGKKAQPCKFL